MAVPAKWKMCLPAEEYEKYAAEYERLRNAGRTDAEAKSQTIAKYGVVPSKPLALPPSAQPSEPVKEVSQFAPPTRAEFNWVWRNMQAKQVTAESAPSHGAYALWELCQEPEGRHVFFNQYMPKMIGKDLEKEDKFCDDDRDLTEQIDKLIKIAEQCSQ